jgi:hypothetical protein
MFFPAKRRERVPWIRKAGDLRMAHLGREYLSGFPAFLFLPLPFAFLEKFQVPHLNTLINLQAKVLLNPPEFCIRIKAGPGGKKPPGLKPSCTELPMTPEITQKAPPPPGWRFYTGVALFLLAWVTPLGIPLVTLLELPLAWKATLSGLLLVGLPEVLSLLAVAFLGKSGFIYIKENTYGFFQKYALPKEVSRRRYRLGLAKFIIPLFCGWLGAYVNHLIPGYAEHRFMINFAGDLIWLSSLFVLGSDFWDKIRALFIYRAKALIP